MGQGGHAIYIKGFGCPVPRARYGTKARGTGQNGLDRACKGWFCGAGTTREWGFGVVGGPGVLSEIFLS